MRFILLSMLICVSHITSAGQVLRNDVAYKNKVYSLEFEAIIDASFDRVYSVLTDFKRLHLLSTAVLKSEILSKNAETTRLYFLTKTCILIFCFKKDLVADVYEPEHGEFHAVNIAELGDFESSQGVWNLAPFGTSGTKIHFKGEVKPKFWIPPVIGLLLIESKMKSIASRSISNLETKLLL